MKPWPPLKPCCRVSPAPAAARASNVVRGVNSARAPPSALCATASSSLTPGVTSTCVRAWRSTIEEGTWLKPTPAASESGCQVTVLRKVSWRAQVSAGSYSGCQRVNSASPPSRWVPPAVIRRLQGTVWPSSVELARGSTWPAASRLSPAFNRPAARALPRSVRRAWAKRTAPSTFSWPVPCSMRLALGKGCAVYCRMALTRGGVRPGLACSSRATAPAVTGAATEVPLSCISVRRGAWLAPGTWLSAG